MTPTEMMLGSLMVEILAVVFLLGAILGRMR